MQIFFFVCLICGALEEVCLGNLTYGLRGMKYIIM